MYKNSKAVPGSMTTSESFLKQSALSLLGLSLLSSTTAASFEQARRGAVAKSTFDTDATTIRSISYTIFNGCIGSKGINGRDLPPGEQSALIRAARDLGQITARIMKELALYKPNLINFSEGPDEETVAEIAKRKRMT